MLVSVGFTYQGFSTSALPPPCRVGSAAACTVPPGRKAMPLAAPISGVEAKVCPWSETSSFASGVFKNAGSAEVCVVLQRPARLDARPRFRPGPQHPQGRVRRRRRRTNLHPRSPHQGDRGETAHHVIRTPQDLDFRALREVPASCSTASRRTRSRIARRRRRVFRGRHGPLVPPAGGCVLLPPLRRSAPFRRGRR